MGDKVINKQGLIFLTLTSLILVLSVYYVTMPNELLLTTNSSYVKKDSEQVVNNEKEKEVNVSKEEEKKNTTVSKEENEKKENETNVVIKNTNTVEALRNILMDERAKTLKELNDKLTNKDLSAEEKNNVYEEIKAMNEIQTMEENIEKKIKSEFNLDSYVKVKDDVIEVVVNSAIHDTNLAVKIMTSVEKDYNDMYISVSFKE